MFAVGGKPVEVLRAVMHGVKAPEETHAMLQAMTPVNDQVAEQDDFYGLQPPRLSRHSGAKRCRHDAVQPTAKRLQHEENEPAPHKVLTEEKEEIGPPVRAKDFLLARGKDAFQRPQGDAEKEKAQAGC